VSIWIGKDTESRQGSWKTSEGWRR